MTIHAWDAEGRWHLSELPNNKTVVLVLICKQAYEELGLPLKRRDLRLVLSAQRMPQTGAQKKICSPHLCKRLGMERGDLLKLSIRITTKGIGF